MSSTESSTSYVIDAEPTLLIWTMFVWAFAIAFVVLLVLMFRRRRSEFKSPASQLLNVRASRIMQVGIGLGIVLDVIVDSPAFASAAIFTVLSLIIARCAIYVWSREPRAPKQPVLS